MTCGSGWHPEKNQKTNDLLKIRYFERSGSVFDSVFFFCFCYAKITKNVTRAKKSKLILKFTGFYEFGICLYFCLNFSMWCLSLKSSSYSVFLITLESSKSNFNVYLNGMCVFATRANFRNWDIHNICFSPHMLCSESGMCSHFKHFSFFLSVLQFFLIYRNSKLFSCVCVCVFVALIAHSANMSSR